MKNSIVFGIMAAIIVVMSAGIACAGSINAPGIDKRQWRQQQKIEHGLASGQLTRWEARALGREQLRIRHLEARMKSDGHLTARERLMLHNRLNFASRDIWRLKHNGQYR